MFVSFRALAQVPSDTLLIVFKTKDTSVQTNTKNRISFSVSNKDSSAKTFFLTGTDGYRKIPVTHPLAFPLLLNIDDSIYWPVNKIIASGKDTVYIELFRKKNQELKEVIVYAHKNAIQENARGAELDISKLKDAKTITVAEALERIPGVEVDRLTGNITYQGRGVAIMKDGITVAGFPQLVKATINSLNASTYKKVSINLYDLKTEQPTISFEEPKFENGVLSNLNTSIGLSNASAGINNTIARGKHIINFSPSVSTRFPSPDMTLQHNRTYLQTGVQTRENIVQNGMKGHQYGVTLGDNFNITERNIVNLSLYYTTQYQTSQSYDRKKEYQSDMLTNETDITSLNRSPGNNNNTLNSTFAFIHKFVPGKLSTSRYDISVNYQKYNMQNISQTRSVGINGDALPGSNYDARHDNKFNNLFTAFSYDYKHQHLGNFEMVLKYFYRGLNDENNNNFLNPGGDSLVAQSYETKYHYGAVLVSWDKVLKPFSIRAVLKQDYSIDKALTSQTERPHFSFSTFVPYISLQKSIKGKSLRLEMDYTSTRPRLEMLTDLINYTDLYNGSGILLKGNPNLKPYHTLGIRSSFSHSFFKKHSVQWSLNYSNTNGKIQANYYSEDKLPIQSYKNLTNVTVLHPSARFFFTIFEKGTLTFTPDYTWSQYRDTVTSTTNSYRFMLEAGYNISSSFKLSLRGDYSRNQYYQTKSTSNVLTIFTASYMAKRTMLYLSVMNWHQPYMTQGYERVSESLKESYRARMRLFGVNLTFSYQLTKPFKQRAADPGKAIIRDDM